MYVSSIYQQLLTKKKRNPARRPTKRRVRLPNATLNDQLKRISHYKHDDDFEELFYNHFIYPRLKELDRLEERQLKLCRKGPDELEEIYHLCKQEERIEEELDLITSFEETLLSQNTSPESLLAPKSIAVSIAILVFITLIFIVGGVYLSPLTLLP